MSIKHIFGEVITPLLHKRGPYFIKILKYWSKMFREEMGTHVFPTSVTFDGTLFVKADAKGILTLRFQKQLAIETINMFLGKTIIKDIKSSPWIRPMENKKPQKPSFQVSEAILSQIQDEELRNSLKSFTEL